jgi:polar amino acid transport system substrate-binding protein
MVFLSASVTLAEDRTITLVADKWCPFNCSETPGHRGILVERAAAVLAREGTQIDYIEMPWSRAITGVRDGTYDAIVGAGRSETPDFHFPTEPLATARHSFFTLASSGWRYRGLESLRRVRIGVIQDYSYGHLYVDYIEPNQGDVARLAILRGNRVLPRLIRMLHLGRIDALVAEESVLNYYFISRGRMNPLRHAGLAHTEALYVAFSPALYDGKELAEALTRGLATVNQATVKDRR